MSDLIQALISWKAFLLALILYGFAPGLVLRLLARLFPASDPRRAELRGELGAVPRWERPLWVAEQVEVALFEGLGGRLRRWNNYESYPIAQMWLRRDEEEGRTISLGIKVSYRDQEYYFPWYHPVFKGHPEIDQPLGGQCPRAVRKVAGRLWTENFDDYKVTRWPPTHIGRAALTAKHALFYAMIIALTPLLLCFMLHEKSQSARFRLRKRLQHHRGRHMASR